MFLVLLSSADVNWLCELPYTLSIPSLNAIIVHAGLLPDREVIDQDPMDMMNMRSIQVSPLNHDNTLGKLKDRFCT